MAQFHGLEAERTGGCSSVGDCEARESREEAREDGDEAVLEGQGEK